MVFNDTIEALVCRCFKYVKRFKPQEETPKGIGDEFEDRFDDFLPRAVEILSRRGEFRFGLDVASASGLRHETDKILGIDDILVVMEFKHVIIDPIKKNPFLIFWAKVMDYYLSFLRSNFKERLYMLFLTCDREIPDDVRLFCFTWGIVLIDPVLRPPDVLVFLSGRLLDKKKEGFLFGIEESYLSSLHRRAIRLCQATRKDINVILFKDPSSFRYLLLNLDKLPTWRDTGILLKEQKLINDEIEKLLEQYRSEGGS